MVLRITGYSVADSVADSMEAHATTPTPASAQGSLSAAVRSCQTGCHRFRPRFGAEGTRLGLGSGRRLLLHRGDRVGIGENDLALRIDQPDRRLERDAVRIVEVDGMDELVVDDAGHFDAGVSQAL